MNGTHIMNELEKKAAEKILTLMASPELGVEEIMRLASSYNQLMAAVTLRSDLE